MTCLQLLDRRANESQDGESRQVICGYAFAAFSHARAVKDDAIWWLGESDGVQSAVSLREVVETQTTGPAEMR